MFAAHPIRWSRMSLVALLSATDKRSAAAAGARSPRPHSTLVLPVCSVPSSSQPLHTRSQHSTPLSHTFHPSHTPVTMAGVDQAELQRALGGGGGGGGENEQKQQEAAARREMILGSVLTAEAKERRTYTQTRTSALVAVAAGVAAIGDRGLPLLSTGSARILWSDRTRAVCTVVALCFSRPHCDREAGQGARGGRHADRNGAARSDQRENQRGPTQGNAHWN